MCKTAVSENSEEKRSAWNDGQEKRDEVNVMNNKKKIKTTLKHGFALERCQGME